MHWYSMLIFCATAMYNTYDIFPHSTSFFSVSRLTNRHDIRLFLLLLLLLPQLSSVEAERDAFAARVEVLTKEVESRSPTAQAKTAEDEDTRAVNTTAETEAVRAQVPGAPETSDAAGVAAAAAAAGMPATAEGTEGTEAVAENVEEHPTSVEASIPFEEEPDMVRVWACV